MLADLLKKENIEHPWFGKNEHVLNLIGAQLGDIAAAKPKLVRQYEAAFATAPPLGRRVIIRALTNAGDKETVAQAGMFLADEKLAAERSDLEALKKHLEDPKRLHIRDRAAAEPKDLDFLWANYYITGEYQPVSRILDVLDLPAAPENATLQRVARWSLGSNLPQHPKLVEIVKEHVEDRPAASRNEVEGLLEALTTVVGTWHSQDADMEPLVFEKDGSFTCGFIKQNGAWVNAKGRYTLLGEGKISTRSQHGGSTLTQTYTLKNGVLISSRGPNPRVEWKKAKP
jgi:uncharacterized protein (TIGR03066 family)